MRKDSMQTQKATGLMQTLGKRGWHKKAKKALAGVLAGAMVLTSGVVTSQNTKTAKAADANADLIVSDEWWDASPNSTHYKLVGDGSITFYVGVLAAELDTGYSAYCVELNYAYTNYITTTSDGDVWGYGATLDSTFEGKYDENSMQACEGCLYRIDITRAGDDYTITYFNVTENQVVQNFKALDAPMGDEIEVYAMAQVGTFMVSPTPFDIVRHTVTVNYLDENGTPVAESAKKDVTENMAYSFSSPDIAGYIPDQFTVTGTMGTEDIEVTVTYHSVPNHSVTVKYVYEDGTIAAESITADIDEGKNYSFSSPIVAGYEPDYLTVSGTMGTEDVTFTVIYTKKDVIATLNSDSWTNFKDAYKVYKTGDFNITFSFHSYIDMDLTEYPGAWGTHHLSMTTNLEEESPSATDWCIRLGLSEYSFGGLGDNDHDVYYSNSFYNEGFDDDSLLEMIKDAETTIQVVRTGTTIAVTTSIRGVNGSNYSETVTAANAPLGEMNVFLSNAESSNTINLYSVTEKEGGSVGIHYVYEDGTTAVSDRNLGWIDKGQSYSVNSPEIEGYIADQPVVSGVMGNDRVEVTVTYTKAPQASEEPTETPVAPTETPAAPTTEPTETPAEPTVEPSTEPTETPATPTVEPSTEPTAEPTTTPSESPTPTKAPTVSKGDTVTASNATYKVTSTKDKSVTYTNTSNKNSKKTSVTVPKTVKVTSGGKQITYKVTTVAKGAFKNNDNVKKITIGENITKIGANAFKGCDNLTTIVINSKKLTSVGSNALKGTSKKLVIKVPAKKLNAYKKLFSGKGNSSVTIKKA